MPTVIHSADRAKVSPPKIELKGRESNLFKILKFFADKGDKGATPKEVGTFLGVVHHEQAILRGSNRIRSLDSSGLVKRGEQLVINSREDHATYHITQKGKDTLAAGFVKAV